MPFRFAQQPVSFARTLPHGQTATETAPSVCNLIRPRTRPFPCAFSPHFLRCDVHGQPRLAPVDRSSTRLSGFLSLAGSPPLPPSSLRLPFRSKRPMAETFRRSVSPAVVRVPCSIVIECRHGATSRLALVLSNDAVVAVGASLVSGGM